MYIPVKILNLTTFVIQIFSSELSPRDVKGRTPEDRTKRIQLGCKKTFFKKASVHVWVHESGKNFPFMTKSGKSEVDFLNGLKTTSHLPKGI